MPNQDTSCSSPAAAGTSYSAKPTAMAVGGLTQDSATLADANHLQLAFFSSEEHNIPTLNTPQFGKGVILGKRCMCKGERYIEPHTSRWAVKSTWVWKHLYSKRCSQITGIKAAESELSSKSGCCYWKQRQTRTCLTDYMAFWIAMSTLVKQMEPWV